MTFHPKQFYRKLDELLHRIQKGRPNEDWYARLVAHIVESFGDEFQHYGALKALCEQAAEKAMGGRATNIRPGLIVGPRDNVPRFTYWPVRVERGARRELALHADGIERRRRRR